MTVEIVDAGATRERAIGVVLALTASSMLGVTLAFARVALGAQGVAPSAAWGAVLTAGWMLSLADPPAPHDRPVPRDGSEAIVGGEETPDEDGSTDRVGRRASSTAGESAPRTAGGRASRIAPIPDDRERASIELRRSWGRGVGNAAARGVGVALLEVALLLPTLRSASALVMALFTWHACHAVLAAITSLRARDATVTRLVTRFAAASWFAVALVVWGLA